jgi:hypothetical protein
MKKLILPAIFTFSMAFSLTSCDEKVCIKCTKVGDPSDTKEFCSSNTYDRNDWTVEQTHLDYNCETKE